MWENDKDASFNWLENLTTEGPEALAEPHRHAKLRPLKEPVAAE